MTLQPPRLLDQVRERLRYKHYSLSTEKTYVYWIRFFIRWSGLRHPKEMGAVEVEAFLTMLAAERQVSPSTHRQALQLKGVSVTSAHFDARLSKHTPHGIF